jgi:hypothetical protein
MLGQGYAYCRHIVAFFNSSKYWLLEPNDALVLPHAPAEGGGSYALADPAGSEGPPPPAPPARAVLGEARGRRALCPGLTAPRAGWAARAVLVYLSHAGPFALTLPGPAGAPWSAEWFAGLAIGPAPTVWG